MPTIFTKIIQGEIPCHKIAETEDFLAFLDIRPLARGHTLAIPKKEVDYIFDVEDDLLQGLIVFSKKVAKAVEATVTCKRVGITVIGTEVPHTHIHLIPFERESQMCMDQPRVEMSDEEMASLAKKIASNFEN